MLRATIWRDLRWRVLPALLLAVPLSALVAWSYAMTVRQDAPAMRGYASYLAYLDAGWFQLPGPSSVFLLVAVIVTAWSGPLRPRDDLAYLLTLPVSPRRLLIAHISASMAVLAAVVLLVDVVLAAGAVGAGRSLALGSLVARSIAVLLSAGAWVGITVSVLMLVRHPAIAVFVVLGVEMLLPGGRFRLEIPARPSAEMLRAWDPWTLADPRAWQGTIPIASLLTAAALATGGTLLALWLLERREP